MSDTVIFFERKFPSANMVLLRGSQPILIDSGFGGDVDETIALLTTAGYPPESLQMIANTHFHCDHNGGNHHLQKTYGLMIAASTLEARMVNSRHREACSAEWLDQPIEPYTVNLPLSDGDILDTGDRQWQVIATPGHTQGHLSYYCDGVLIAGDTIHADDVAWLNAFREGATSIYQMLDTLDRLARLPISIAYSGHGKATTHPSTQLDYARKRYEKWLGQPEKVAWHAMKRIFAYALMLFDGMSRADVETYLLRSHWYYDYCTHVFEAQPVDMIAPFIAELLRSGAAIWQDDKLMPCAPYNAPDIGWMVGIKRPKNW